MFDEHEIVSIYWIQWSSGVLYRRARSVLQNCDIVIINLLYQSCPRSAPEASTVHMFTISQNLLGFVV